MSLNAGAGAGSSCPDVAVERRLRVPTLFWSTVQNAIPRRMRLASGRVRDACRRVPPGGAPGSFIRSARIIRTHGGCIQHSTYNRDTRPLRGRVHPRDRPTPSGRLQADGRSRAHRPGRPRWAPPGRAARRRATARAAGRTRPTRTVQRSSRAPTMALVIDESHWAWVPK